MKIAGLMTRNLITVRPMDSVEQVTSLLSQRGVRHLLVLDRSRLVGILSDRDLRRSLNPAKTKKRIMAVGGLYFMLEPILVEEIMTRDPVTISSGSTAEQAARIMLEHRFGALPVVDQGKVVGIVTETDLLRHFVAVGESTPDRAASAPPRKPAIGARSKPKSGGASTPKRTRR